MMLLVGCATSTTPLPTPVITLDNIQDTVTTREQCLQRLGPPSKQTLGSTGGQVLMYGFGHGASGLHAGWYEGRWTEDDSRYSLVLSFDNQGVLTRHALVKVWGR